MLQKITGPPVAKKSLVPPSKFLSEGGLDGGSISGFLFILLV